MQTHTRLPCLLLPWLLLLLPPPLPLSLPWLLLLQWLP